MKANFHYEIIGFYLDSMDFVKTDPTLSYAFKMYFLDISLKLKNENLNIFTNAMIDIIFQCVDEAEQLKTIVKVDHLKYLEDYITKFYDSVIKEFLNLKTFTFQMLKKYKLLNNLMEISHYYSHNKKWEQKKLLCESKIKEIETFLKQKKELEKNEKTNKNVNTNPQQKLQNAIKKLQAPQRQFEHILAEGYDKLVANKNQINKDNQNILDQESKNLNIKNADNKRHEDYKLQKDYKVLEVNKLHEDNKLKEDNKLFENNQIPKNNQYLKIDETLPQRSHKSLKEDTPPLFEIEKDPCIPVNQIREAKKYAEYAINELEFKKINTAINFLVESIKYL